MRDPVSLANGDSSEVELISLVGEPVPKYKLRVDTITEFTGYKHNDWFIETPLIDLDAPIELSPAILHETFAYFIQSGQRVSQMTKVYNDVDALTKLLEEKERDLELAARIGQSLLEQNRGHTERIDELEDELIAAKDKIIQLKHEISAKQDLLRVYLKDEDEDEDELQDSSISSVKEATFLLEELEKRVGSLEDENKKLKTEREIKAFDIEEEERRELQLIDECAKRLTTSNKQISQLQEELTRKNEENGKLKSEIRSLSGQVANLEKRVRKLTFENDELEASLNLAHECQSELTIELIDVKEKHNNLLTAFHEKQEECRQLKRHSLSDPLFPYVESLAYELEQSLHGTLSSYDTGEEPNLEGSLGNCFTPDSLLSSDSFYTNSPFASLGTYNSEVIKSQASQLSNTSAVTAIQVTSHEASTVQAPSPSVITVNKSVRSIHRQHFFTDKLRYIKPIEGSQILNHWRKLASPSLSNLFEDRDKYISRIQANLAATEARTMHLARETKLKSSSSAMSSQVEVSASVSNTEQPRTTAPYQNNFVTTNSVFTFTTTSLSHTKESVTHVTTSFSNVKPSLVKHEFEPGVGHKHQPRLSVKPPVSLEGETTTTTTSVTSTSESAKSVQNPLSGLNELARLVNWKESIDLSARILTKSPGSRLVTRVMANRDVPGISPLKLSKPPPINDAFRADMSVLRNLRKGGLI